LKVEDAIVCKAINPLSSIFFIENLFCIDTCDDIYYYNASCNRFF
jgi:hypothetical protein